MTEAAKRRRESPDVRRAQILDAARRCFRTLGFQASTVDRIAGEAGVSVGLLYRFFASKSAIIEAIIVEDVEQQLEQVGGVVEMCSGDPLKLAELITDQVVEETFNRERLALMFEIAAEVCRNPVLGEFVRKKRIELRKILADRLSRKGLDRRSTLVAMDKLDAANAVASGLAMQAMIYSEGSRTLNARKLSRLLKTAIFSPDAP